MTAHKNMYILHVVYLQVLSGYQDDASYLRPRYECHVGWGVQGRCSYPSLLEFPYEYIYIYISYYIFQETSAVPLTSFLLNWLITGIQIKNVDLYRISSTNKALINLYLQADYILYHGLLIKPVLSREINADVCYSLNYLFFQLYNVWLKKSFSNLGL